MSTLSTALDLGKSPKRVPTCQSRVAAFRQYLLKTLGKSTLDRASPFDASFHGKPGIVAFSVNWHDATGHIALFDGTAYREPDHDNYAAYVNAVDPKIRTTRVRTAMANVKSRPKQRR